jgi:hypothetical protein
MTVLVVGPIVALGHLGAIILGSVEGAALGGGMSALAAALFSIGIPKDTVIDYETAVKTESFLVMVDGSSEKVDHVKTIPATANLSRLDVHEGATAPSAMRRKSPDRVSRLRHHRDRNGSSGALMW